MPEIKTRETVKEIALEDGVSITSVFESISSALEKMRVFYRRTLKNG